jgi:hypothetical protein
MSMTVNELMNILTEGLSTGRFVADDLVVGETFTYEDMFSQDMNMTATTARYLFREVAARVDRDTTHTAIDNEVIRDVMSEVWFDYVPGDENKGVSE